MRVLIFSAEIDNVDQLRYLLFWRRDGIWTEAVHCRSEGRWFAESYATESGVSMASEIQLTELTPGVHRDISDIPGTIYTCKYLDRLYF